MTTPEDSVTHSAARRRRGRPKVIEERRARIINAFIDLVAERGLEAVSIGDVAETAGVARTAIRHFVGNRPQLIEGALETLVRRYLDNSARTIGELPSADALASFLFSPQWVEQRSVNDLAFDALHEHAARDPDIRALVRTVYATMQSELVDAMVREGGGPRTARYLDAAYQVMCLAEHNVALQALGFPAVRSRAAATLARRIVAEAAT